jgi:hypothetical protein
MAKTIKRGGELWEIREVRRGRWTAECSALDLKLRAETEAALMSEIDEALELLPA